MTESAPDSAPEPMKPVAGGERLDIVDVIRGFAVFGILLVNMQFFNGPQTLRGSGVEWFPGGLDQAVRSAITFFAEGKFYSIFSTLFGLGLAIQMERAAARGAKIGKLYFRRLVVLLLIGLIHAFLIWWGDILAIYAMVGMLLLAFRNIRPKWLLVWALILFAIPVGILCVMGTGLLVVTAIPEVGEAVQPQLDEALEGMARGVQDSYDAYAVGGFG
ncbi:MAG: hypothetical protein R3344_07840, partial [Acidobacteriota bacterium]|nr:hypothetical protein [Acidobacteriota bacterium]